MGATVSPAGEGGLKVAKEIPAFGSEKTEADFWDTHDTLEYAEGEPVHLELEPEVAKKLVDRQKSKRVTLRLREYQIEDAKIIAREREIPYQTLMRSWIADGIKRERAK